METGLLLALLAVAGGLAVRRRLRRRRGSVLSDGMIRRIEAEGRVEADVPEPLDHAAIRGEEEAFWSQTWDEPEEL